MRSAANTDEIKDTIHAARAAPAADAFDGWLGVKASALGETAIQTILEQDRQDEGWIYIPER